MTGLALNPLDYIPSSSSLSYTIRKCAWVVFLLTTPSYLPGILVLAYTLRKYNSKYPLIVAINPSIPAETIKVLEEYELEIRIVQPLVPRGQITLIAERFVDTWTKAAVFGFDDYDRVCLIDGDMMLKRNMDEIFEIPLKEDQIAATFACICNLDKSSWAPAEWTRDNCGFTPSHGSESITHPGPAQPTGIHSLLNSGLVVLTPSQSVLQRIYALVESGDKDDQERIKEWAFPDQDLFADLFRGKWISIPWIYNAIKTMRYWHGNFYTDHDVRNLHYICRKPWKYRPKYNTPEEYERTGNVYKVEAGEYSQVKDNDVGFNEREADAVTHGWWWEEYDCMLGQMRKSGYEWCELVDELTDRGES
ncbi:hypothetical protein I203_108083 [Kwoniella mangroviensis CBS 8507]|uniref:hypothetical protein n=1 Tax=Kwoniella mangroviensis CBS 8507 TaxID=1296122 RepID=UPI00080D6124|nr:uncharacterized protein I203_04978 [Kwoniella mangroviensis CBS 8507]OCF65956.1 hypothetical protein I203_04978 [Kwoniella mangroviensis CBS 8507]